MNFRLKKFSTKKGVNRQPGECDVLLNTTPMRTVGSETTRYGYSSAGLPALPANITADYYRYASTENPEAKDVLFLFGHETATPANQHIYVYDSALVDGDTFTSRWIDVTENYQFTGTWILGASTITIPSAVSNGFPSIATNYYKGWKVYNETQNKSIYIKSSSSSGADLVLTVAAVIDTWPTTDDLRVYRWFHNGGTGYSTVYGGVKFSRPAVKTDKGIFKIGLGKNLLSSYKPLWAGYINRTYFPAEGTDSFIYKGTYVTLRECAAHTPSSFVPAIVAVNVAASEVALETLKTYWFALEPIYDGFQHGKLYKISGQYLSTADKAFSVPILIEIGSLDRRITGFNLYVSVENGDTHSNSKTETPYYFIKELPITDALFTGWGLSSNGIMGVTVRMDKNVLDAKGSNWINASGYVDGTDTMPTYDIEESSGDRNWIASVYRILDSQQDLDNIYTNPRSEEGLIQPDIFSYEPQVFTHRVLYGDSSYITGLVSTGRGKLLVLKDRGVVEFTVTEQADGILVQSAILGVESGCASLNGYVKTPYDDIYFVGYNDIYRYLRGAIEPLTLEDWEDTYRGLTTANKQACIAWFKLDDFSVNFQIGSDVYVYYGLTKDWRKHTHADVLTGLAVKRDNAIVWTASNGTAYAFDTSATDRGTAIPVKWTTGYFRYVASGEIGIFKSLFINKNLAASSGTLDCRLKLKLNGVLVGNVTTGITLTALDKSTRRLKLSIINDSNLYGRKFDELSIEYNTNASPETGTIEFGDIELYADVTQKLG